MKWKNFYWIILNTTPDPNQPFYAMYDASHFGIGSALLQSRRKQNEHDISKLKNFYTDSLQLCNCNSYIIFIDSIWIFNSWIKTSNNLIYWSETH